MPFADRDCKRGVWMFEGCPVWGNACTTEEDQYSWNGKPVAVSCVLWSYCCKDYESWSDIAILYSHSPCPSE